MTASGHQGEATDSSTLLIPEKVQVGPSMAILPHALLYWSVGWDLALPLTPSW